MGVNCLIRRSSESLRLLFVFKRSGEGALLEWNTKEFNGRMVKAIRVSESSNGNFEVWEMG